MKVWPLVVPKPMMAQNLPSDCDTVRKSCWLCCSHDAGGVPRVDK